ncbi:MAG TPA: SpoIIE family protein phosphatase [Candidatus Kapabacteria bacterium]|jgi:sigma-B regulation protein RsbU (phosphoserine phosphatase)|nr:SpoIIE family protein phosphatase [Candidatus Kapabacteria bacterium]HPP39031.1 SpoIIE family protein phosphatase [Candidatus Kapabacteria bacterium]HPU23122.1 SpoIIE family protein phosphatase [Candidatus Kapabacteria bacterium]
MNKKILFVDDEINVLHGYRRNLRSLFDVHIANSGSEALKIIAEQGDFAVIISDYRMPEMDGIELLHKVKEISPDTIRIILTGFADMQIAIEAINEGNIFRFLTKPLPTDKLINSINDALEQYRLITTEKELTRKLQEAYDTIRKDLETAAELQREFLPQNNVSFGDCRFNWIFVPSVFVSGDTFNFFPLNNRHIAFYIVDVAGHGLPAAFLSVSLSRSLSQDTGKKLLLDEKTGDYILPSLVIKSLNEQFLSRGKNAEYFTMLYGVIDLIEDKIVFSQAGHPNPFLIKAGGKAEIIVSRGFPVGILPEAEYYDQIIPFETGDKFIIYTDGITECTGVKNKLIIQNKLVEFLNNHSNNNSEIMLRSIVPELKVWTNGEEFYDDLTMLIIERKLF